jgi:hypothetical protein
MDDWDFHRQAIVNWPLVDEAELKRHSVFQDGVSTPTLLSA